jgi:uncharacterized protein YodC (DUF2158 family)
MGSGAQQVAVGDMVMLKSGGHSMMVEKIDNQGVHCVWSDNKVARARIFDSRIIAAKPTETKMTIHLTPTLNDIENLAHVIAEASDRDSHNRLIIDIGMLKKVLRKELASEPPK